MKDAHKIYNLKWLWLFIPLIAFIIIALFYPDIKPVGQLRFITRALHAIIMTAGLWLGCMLIVSVLWKKFPWEKFPLKHLIYEIVLILLYTNIFSGGLYWLELRMNIFKPFADIYTEIIITNLITLFITLLHEAISFYHQWKLHFSKSVKLEKDNIEAKYETLKAQINPHFLFNSLNSLTNIVEENANAVEYIRNLSDFLRYVLKSRDRELVLVREEVNILVNYINLQKIRFNQNLQIELDVKEESFHYSIPPLVLQMLVENCIKHNIISKEKPLKIRIWNDKEQIHVENNYQKKHVSDSTGNGLRNISERYQFFTPAGIKITETDSIFKVSVPLLISEL